MIHTIENFEGYDWQNYCLHNLTRNNVIVAPRQHGKTTLMCELINTVAHAPNIKQPLINLCSDAASTLYKIYSQRLNDLFEHNPLWSWKHADTPTSRVLRSDGKYALVNFIGSVKKPDGCTGTPAHLNIIDEAAKVAFDFIYKSAMPATDKTEGITIITGTVADNQYRDIFESAYDQMQKGNPHWFAFYMRLDDEWSKNALSAQARDAIWKRYNLEDPKQKQIFDAEYLCEWESGIKEGRPYYKGIKRLEEEGRIQEFEVNRHYPVGLAWDDGRATTAVWCFQLVGNTIFLFDYKEWYDGDLHTIGTGRYNWYRDNNFIIGPQVLPHTFRERSFNLASKISRYEQLRSIFKHQGAYINLPRVGDINTKLQAGKQLFSKCIIHPRCENPFQGITHLRRYSRGKTKNKLSGEDIYTDQIARDSHSHGGDAFGELAMSYKTTRLFKALDQLSMQRTSILPLTDNRRTILSPY